MFAYLQKTTAFGYSRTVGGSGGVKKANTLLKAGADLKARDKYGRSPLMASAQDNQNPEVIVILLKAGADGKAKKQCRKDSLRLCARQRKVERHRRP